MLENGRAGELRALLGGLVADAKRKRDRVGLIVFRGREARLVAPPSRNHAAVLAGLETVEPGGTTPLAEGIRVAHETATRELRRNPDLRADRRAGHRRLRQRLPLRRRAGRGAHCRTGPAPRRHHARRDRRDRQRRAAVRAGHGRRVLPVRSAGAARAPKPRSGDLLLPGRVELGVVTAGRDQLVV